MAEQGGKRTVQAKTARPPQAAAPLSEPLPESLAEPTTTPIPPHDLSGEMMAEAGARKGPPPASLKADPSVPELGTRPEAELSFRLPPNAAGPEGQEAAADPASPKEPPARPPAMPAQRSRPVLPLLLGGLLAGGIGFGAGWWLLEGSATANEDAIEARLATQAEEMAAQSQEIAALTERLAALPEPLNPAPLLLPLEEEIAALRAEFTARAGATDPALAALSGRIDALERAPEGDGTLTETALAAWASDLDALRADLSDQAGRLDALTTSTADLAALRADLAAQAARLDALADETAGRAEAAAAERAALESAALAAAEEESRRAALAQLLTALDTGAPFEAALAAALGDTAPPPTLAATATSGIAPLADLRAEFPAAARAGLAAARAAGESGEAGGFGGYLRDQLNIRSTAPREGDDPDAILSRAQAAVEAGEIDAALAELAALPEAARTAMADWLTRASTRQAALSEAAILSNPVPN